MKLVLFPSVDPSRLERIHAAAGPMAVVNVADEGQAQHEMVDADAFFGKLTPRLLAVAERLRWVQTPTVSLEHFVFPELVAHPCLLTNMRGLFSDVIAEQVFGYLIMVARNLHIYVRQQQQQRWEPVGGEAGRANFTVGPAYVGPIDLAHRQLSGATLGIVGLGQIGQEIARRAEAFGMRTVAVDARPRDVPGVAIECRPAEQLSWLLDESDYVVIAAPHTPATAGLFGRPQFRAMKRTAWLVNIGRGAIVKLSDLVESLRAGEIAGAALDVFETEPLPADHPLWRMQNVIITPHVAGYAPSIAERHLELLLDNIARFVRGQELRNLADKATWF